jgi:hypothetical protein
MSRYLLIAFTIFTGLTYAQTDSTKSATSLVKDLKLTNAVIISHLDKQEDRFSLEVAMSEVFSATGKTQFH